MSIVRAVGPATLRDMTELVLARGITKMAKLPDEEVQTSHAEFCIR
jgi:hypothetical protein